MELVCTCTSNIIMYFQFYFRLFSENDGLHFCTEKTGLRQIRDTGIAVSDNWFK